MGRKSLSFPKSVMSIPTLPLGRSIPSCSVFKGGGVINSPSGPTFKRTVNGPKILDLSHPLM